GDLTSLPSYVTMTASGNSFYAWAPSTADARGLRKASAPTDRIAACWYSFASMSLDLNFTDSKTHQIALYLLDWDNFGRADRVDILDGSGNVLDTRTASNFVGGQYLVWNLGGHVIVRITNAGGGNAVISGVFFGGS